MPVLGTEALEYALAVGPKMSVGSLSAAMINIFSGGESSVKLWQDANGNVDLLKIVGLITDVVVEEAVRSENPSEKLKSAAETINVVRKSAVNVNVATLTDISRKLSREPVIVESVSTLISSLVERISSKVVSRIFTLQSR